MKYVVASRHNDFLRRMFAVILLGFSSGIPFSTTQGTLQAWMKDVGVDLSVIALFGIVRIPYSLKFLWAPFFDRFIPPLLGRRRGWMLLSQLALIGALFALSGVNPRQMPAQVAVFTLLVCFCSASQDIVLDAHRRDMLSDKELGLGSSLFIAGYRLGMLFSGGFAFWLATQMSWNSVYLILACSVVLGIAGTLLAPEPVMEGAPPQTLQEAVFDPLRDFFQRARVLEILLFIVLYKLGDNLVGAVSTYFILDNGFSKAQYFAIVKSFGLIAMIGGGLIGGGIILKIGQVRALWIFGALQSLSTLGFAILTKYPGNVGALTGVIVFETLSIGLSTSAYAAYMASLCNKRFSATQYALFSGLMGLPSLFLGLPSGYLAKHLGWDGYFLICAVLSLPGMALLLRVAPWPRSIP